MLQDDNNASAPPLNESRLAYRYSAYSDYQGPGACKVHVYQTPELSKSINRVVHTFRSRSITRGETKNFIFSRGRGETPVFPR